jgi:phosphate transport system substrate-binding protein
MTSKYTIAIALVVTAIIIGSSAAYVYIGSNATANPTATATPSAGPTTSPTVAPSATAGPSSLPTHRTIPTTHPTTTSTPNAAPTPSPSPTPVPVPASLTGAGASFPYPLINAMINNYTTDRTYIQVNYQSIGSGGGILAMQQKTVDFGGSDAPLTTTEQTNVPNALHIPETIGAVTVTYNLPGIPAGLHLTGQVIANIYLGTITQWNDPAIQALNPSTNLPAHAIMVVHRSDSSGTSFVFTGYLSAVSTAWSLSGGGPGQGKSVAWPVGSAASGNAGVAGIVEGNAYTIGYVELAYTVENSMKVAAVQNPAGNWIMPTLASTTAAAASVASAGLPAGSASWTSVNILNAPDAQAYPIVSFSYIIVYKELNVVTGLSQSDATALVQWLWYMVHGGQDQAAALSYAPLPLNVVQIDETTIKSITYNGQVVYTS